jgi:N6-adenosine-specific RNA methylase IME4
MITRFLDMEKKKQATIRGGQYGVIYADPPWSYADKGCNGNASDHYSLMTAKDIAALPVNQLAAKDCVLFMWGTYPLLKEALAVIEGWGFVYKSIGFQWVKLNKKNGKPFYGLGRWTRGNTEPCLIAVRGKPKRIAADVFQLVQSPIRGHSAKPPEVREKIVRLMGDVPRIELFARERAEGWDSTGFDLDGLDIRDVLKQCSTNSAT